MAAEELQAGGRNYVLNSNRYFNTEGIWILDQADLDVQSLRGKTIAVSIDIELVNGTKAVGKQNRLGYEPVIEFADGSKEWYSCWYNLPSNGASYKGRITKFYTVPDKEIVSILQVVALQVSGDIAKMGRPQFEIGNVATDWTPAIEDIQTSLSEHNAFQPVFLGAGTDLNAVKTPGMFYCNSSELVKQMFNVPVAEAFSLFVEKHEGAKQTLTMFSDAEPQIWFRNYYEYRDRWGSWRRITTTEDIPSTLPASDVYPWAKQASKPAYSASEISGMPAMPKVSTGATAPSGPKVGDIFIKTA